MTEKEKFNKNIQNFKRWFLGDKPKIQVTQKGESHKIESLQNKTADFLAKSEVTIEGFPVNFEELRVIGSHNNKATGYNIKNISRVLYRVDPTQAPALETIYDTISELQAREGKFGFGEFILHHLWPCKIPRRFIP